MCLLATGSAIPRPCHKLRRSIGRSCKGGSSDELENTTECNRHTKFLGLAGYYQRFIEGFSKLAGPLTSLTKKNAGFHWLEKQESAFQEIKRRLTQAPILTLPNGNEDLEVYTDASHHGLGCVLMQRGRVIAYASRQTVEDSRG